MITKTYDMLALYPAFSPDLAVLRNVTLPCGGPWGVGGKFARGLVLACVGGAPANAVWTLDIGGTGTVTWTYVAEKVYQATHAHNATPAAVKAALETIFGTGNLTVTGTAGTQYVVTFGGALAAKRIGGSVTVTGATPSFARTTPGSCGAGQYDAYANGSIDPARAILERDFASDPLGGQVSEWGPTYQPYHPPAFFAGFFRAADLVGLDSAAVSDPGFRLALGAAITDAGAVIALGL